MKKGSEVEPFFLLKIFDSDYYINATLQVCANKSPPPHP